MGIKNERKTKSYVTKKLKNINFQKWLGICEYREFKTETKKFKKVKAGPLLPLKIVTFIIEIGGGGWGLEQNFFEFQNKENFWEAKFYLFI